MSDNHNLSQEDERLLEDMLAAYKIARRTGKFAAVCVVGFLGFIVLLSQAWEAFRGFFSKVGLH